MGRAILITILLSILFTIPAEAQNLQGTFRGNADFPSFLLDRGEDYWAALREIFRVNPPSPIHITFYDGRLDYLENKPHPSAPDSIDALLLFNRIHFILENRRPYTNEFVLFHELVHIFQRQFYSLTPHNVWFSDFQAEYLVGLYFFGNEYHNHLRENLNFDPEVIRRRLGRDMDWRYNRSLGIVVIDYLLDKYRLRPDLMHQLVIAVQSENLLHQHQKVVSSALDFLEQNQDKYGFASREGYPSLPPSPGFIPTPTTFSRKENLFIFHSFFLEETYHSLGAWDPEQENFSPYIVSKDYLDWPTLGPDNLIFYVRRKGDEYNVVLGNKENPELEIIFSSDQYLSNLFFDPDKGILFFAKDTGPYRHLFSFDSNGNIETIANGPYQNWSPFKGKDNDLYFLSNRNHPQKVPGGDLFLFREGEIIEKTKNYRLLEILDREEDKLLIKFIHPETGAEALGIYNEKTGTWDKTITKLPSTPYFPHFWEGDIFFWQSPFN